MQKILKIWHLCFCQYARSTPKASLTTSQDDKVERGDSFQTSMYLKKLCNTFFWSVDYNLHNEVLKTFAMVVSCFF